MHIEIDVPRPRQTMMLLAAVVGVVVWNLGDAPSAEGGVGEEYAATVHEAEEEIKGLRLEQEVLNRREEILQAELDALEDEAAHTRDPRLLEELSETRQRMVKLLGDKRTAEEEILASLRQIWEAQGYAHLSSGQSNGADVAFMWPIEPTLGISAHFDDAGYEKRFGLAHKAIDIPANQNSVIVAAADGVVAKVSDNGMGFNSIVMSHDGGFSTLYGHVSEFLVQEGDTVMMGDPIARSGGRPGTPGAGRLTTGAHLHLELFLDGAQVDPLEYLPFIPGIN